jgi:hypothetical protein
MRPARVPRPSNTRSPRWQEWVCEGGFGLRWTRRTKGGFGPHWAPRTKGGAGAPFLYPLVSPFRSHLGRRGSAIPPDTEAGPPRAAEPSPSAEDSPSPAEFWGPPVDPSALAEDRPPPAGVGLPAAADTPALPEDIAPPAKVGSAPDNGRNSRSEEGHFERASRATRKASAASGSMASRSWRRFMAGHLRGEPNSTLTVLRRMLLLHRGQTS